LRLLPYFKTPERFQKLILDVFFRRPFFRKTAQASPMRPPSSGQPWRTPRHSLAQGRGAARVQDDRLPSTGLLQLTRDLVALSRQQSWQQAIARLHQAEQSGLQLDVIALSAAARAAGRAPLQGWARSLHALLEGLRGRGLWPSTSACNAALAALATQTQTQTQSGRAAFYSTTGGGWAAAVWLLQQMRRWGLRQDVLGFGAVISTCGRAGRWPQAAEVLLRLQLAGIQPSSTALNAMVSACEKGGRWRLALRLLEQGLLGAVASADLVTYSAAISACEKCGQADAALQLLEGLLCGGEGGHLPSPGLRVDVIAWNSAMSACATGTRWECTLGLLQRMDGHGLSPDVISGNAGIQAWGYGGDWAAALGLFSSMRARHLRPTAVSFVAALTACGPSSRRAWRQALSFFFAEAGGAEQPGGGGVPAAVGGRGSASSSVCGALLRAFGGDSEGAGWRRALDVLRSVERRGGRLASSVWSSMAAACEQEDSLGAWRRVLAAMDAGHLRGDASEAETLGVALAACSRAARWQACVRLLAELTSLAQQQSFVACSEAEWRAGRSGAGRPGVATLSATLPLEAVSEACARAGSWSRIPELLQELGKRGADCCIASD
ncbi:unnamed protein product, partial [Polarella glacialis]